MKSSTFRLLIIIALLAALIVGAVNLLIGLYLYDDNEHKITGLKLEQEEFTIHVKWDKEKCNGYRIFILHGAGMPDQVDVDTNRYDLEGVEIGTKYKIIVSAVSADGTASGATNKTLKTRKIKQSVTGVEESYQGFKGDTAVIEGQAEGQVVYASGNEGVVSVDQQGKVTFKKPGHTAIKVSTEGTDDYAAASYEAQVTVYPDSLSKPSAKVKNNSGTESTISWKKLKYATGYEVLRKNPATDKYEKVKKTKADKSKVKMPRDQASYEVRGIIEVGDKKIKGDASKPVEVKSSGEKADSYSSKHILKTLDSSELEQVAMISRSGSINVPQSMSFDGENYIVTFVDHASRNAAMQVYDRDGNLIKTKEAPGVGHANGSACDLGTGRVMTVKTSKSVKKQSYECVTFDAETLEPKGSVTLPKSTSGIAYDYTNDKIYLSRGSAMYVCDSDLNVEQFFVKKSPYKHSQDIGGYNGIIFACTWISGHENYVDMYRISDESYIGSYSIPTGELESCCIDDGHLVILVNTKGSRQEYIYRTKDRISF